jgi:hypothetical protein
MSVTDNPICDFCADVEPVWMYEHPEIKSKIVPLTWAAGHVGACATCATLLEAGNLRGLAERVMTTAWALEANRLDSQMAGAVREELVRFYGKISRVREPFKMYSEAEDLVRRLERER